MVQPYYIFNFIFWQETVIRKFTYGKNDIQGRKQDTCLTSRDIQSIKMLEISGQSRRSLKKVLTQTQNKWYLIQNLSVFEKPTNK